MGSQNSGNAALLAARGRASNDSEAGAQHSSELVSSIPLVVGRLRAHCALRLAVSVAVVLGAVYGREVMGIPLDVRALVVLAIAIAVYDLVAFLLVQQHRQFTSESTSHRLLRGVRHGSVILDYLALTVLVYLVGGPATPFAAVYLLHIALNSIMMSRRAVIVHSFIGYGLLSLLVFSHLLQWVPTQQTSSMLCLTPQVDNTCAATLLVVYGALFALFTAMLTNLSSMLRREEEKALQANRELARLSKNRRDFLQVALHDLKSPVSAATMLLSNLASGLAGDLRTEQHQLVERSLRRLNDCTRSMRNFQTLSLLESGDFEKQVKQVDLNELMREIAEEHHEDISQHQHTLSFELTEPLQPAYGIPFLLKEALANFLTNAVKYTPTGGRIMLRTRRTGNAVQAEVEDTGPGIPTEDREQLFQEFVRLKPRQRAGHKTAGSGLGLSLAKRIAESHGGTVEVSSEPGRGACFSLVLPLQRPSRIL